jgi:uncharacterized protein DUF2442
MHKLKSICALSTPPYALELVWEDGRIDVVDLSGVIGTYKVFAPLRDNPKLFHAVRMVDCGLGIAWNNDVDYSAQNLRRLADECRLITDAKAVKVKRELPVSTATGGTLPGININDLSSIQEMEDLEYIERMKRFK